MAYEKEVFIAQLAVQRAVILTSRVFVEKAKGAVDKADKSPVTFGDFGAQALIISALRANFPQDEIVAEEESSKLIENATLRKQVWDLVKETSLDDAAAEETLGGSVKTEEDMLKLIDMGNSKGGAKGRIWAIDPIDGTKGFLRGGQYAVCLALMVDGDVKVGVLGCPNLPVDDSAPMTAEISPDSGVLFAAVQGGGSISRKITTGALSVERSISMRPLTDISKAAFCESVESGHSALDEQAIISQRLGITAPSVRMDSQAKYASIARGAGDIYLRLPTSKTYEEKIWDHAAGYIIVKEAGGVITDANGKELDFSIGKTLKANKGIVGAQKNVQAEVLKAVQAVLAERDTAKSR
jgi:3'(2'), 5'-bisphosphate nucleotidase